MSRRSRFWCYTCNSQRDQVLPGIHVCPECRQDLWKLLDLGRIKPDEIGTPKARALIKEAKAQRLASKCGGGSSGASKKSYKRRPLSRKEILFRELEGICPSCAKAYSSDGRCGCS